MEELLKRIEALEKRVRDLEENNTHTTCPIFIADPKSGTAPKCINCGRDALFHTLNN